MEAVTSPARECSVERLAALAKDAFYVSIGFGVLGFQRLQVLRREAEQARQRRAG
jgi:hypothetical protein